VEAATKASSEHPGSRRVKKIAQNGVEAAEVLRRKLET